MTIEFLKATTVGERSAINLFLTRHNTRGQGSTKGYVAYYAAVLLDDGKPLIDRLVAVAKICPLHTPQAAKFFAGNDWRHVYCLQRLAAYRAPDNLLSQFIGWILREAGRDERIWYVATYADTGTLDDRTGKPHNGGIYRATNAVYAGMTKGKKAEGFILDGKRHSMRCGPKTYKLADLPESARVLRSSRMHRYCWAVGSPLKKVFRLRVLAKRMGKFKFEAMYQPRLLARLRRLFSAGGKGERNWTNNRSVTLWPT
jgi:hypothetical protein